jgi:hypothetical protein
MGKIILLRKIAIPNFYSPGKHIYEDQLGWNDYARTTAGSYNSKEIFDMLIVTMGLNLAFYYIDNDTFYGLHTECYPIEFKILPRDRSEEFIGWQCDGDTHNDGEVLASFDDEHDIWDNIKIDGKSLEEVLRRSYIIYLT